MLNELIVAAILGIIEGLTEFIPVSSTGHLIIASELLGQGSAQSDSFNIIIQLGAILAVIYLYFGRFKSLVQNAGQLKRIPHKLNAIHILLAILPVLIVGFFTRKWIKIYLFNSDVVVFSLIFVGVLMITMEKFKPTPTKNDLNHITYRDAFAIGILQIFALIPGVSRSGATILAAMWRKIDVKTSADFSFLISVPVIGLATCYEFLKVYQTFTTADFLKLAVGFIVSFLVAIAGIKSFLVILKKLSLTPFAVYRILFGLIFYLLKN